MIRTIVTPKNTEVLITIPKDYVGRELEITFLATDELIEKKPQKNTMAKFWGVISNETTEILHKHVEESRNEWERDI